MEAYCIAKSEDPNNPQLSTFESKGGFKVMYYDHSMPDVIVTYLVEALNNNNGLGATNTPMQKVRSA